MKNRILHLLILALSLFSCEKFLEPKSKSEFVPKDAVSLNELLLGEAYPTYEKAPLNVFLNILDDDVACTPFQETKVGQDRNLWWAAYSWQPQMYELFKEAGFNPGNYNIYKTYYSLILGANAILDYIEDMDDGENITYLVTAQALALRGFYYFTLVNLFGNPYYYNKEAPGVPLKLTSGIENSNLSRNNVSEVYTQVLKDLLEAERLYKLLPKEEQWKQNHRTSLPMVQLLLSRVYLYMEDWENAAIYAEKVINEHNFHLLDLNGVADVGANGKPTFRNYHTYDSPEAIWLYGSIQDVTNMACVDGVNEHVIFKASDELIASYEETSGDLRATRYIIREVDTRIIDGEPVFVPQAFGKININPSTHAPSGMRNFGRSLRLSEAYLNLSEAAAMIYKKDQDNSARNRSLHAVNTLRLYRFDPESYEQVNITDPEQLIQFIRNERRRELCFEDHRWFDLRRWGMKEIKRRWPSNESTDIEYTLRENDPSFTLPFPPEAIDLNKRLEQNPLAPAPRTN